MRVLHLKLSYLYCLSVSLQVVYQSFCFGQFIVFTKNPGVLNNLESYLKFFNERNSSCDSPLYVPAAGNHSLHQDSWFCGAHLYTPPGNVYLTYTKYRLLQKLYAPTRRIFKQLSLQDYDPTPLPSLGSHVRELVLLLHTPRLTKKNNMVVTLPTQLYTNTVDISVYITGI